VADPGAYTKEELATLHSQIVSNLERAWEISGGSEDQLLSTTMQISQVVTWQFTVTGLRHLKVFIGDLDRLGDDLVPDGVQPGQLVSARPGLMEAPALDYRLTRFIEQKNDDPAPAQRAFEAAERVCAQRSRKSPALTILRVQASGVRH